MSVKKKPRGKPFAKGNKEGKGSGKGRTPITLGEIQKSNALDKATLYMYLTTSLHLSDDELKARLKDKTLPVIHGMIAAVMLRIRKSGDVYALNALMDRIVGPITQKIEVDRTNRFVNMSEEELLAEKRRLAGLVSERLKQIELGPAMYAQTLKDVTPHASDDKSKAGTTEPSSSGNGVASA